MNTPRPSHAPSAFISWAHSDPDWDAAQVAARRQHVLRLAQQLRHNGIDADLDMFHVGDADWTRWGPRRIAEVDRVLIIASTSWRHAWEGTGDLQRNVGAGAEADVLRSLSSRHGRDALPARCRIVLLPGSNTSDIPDGMHGIERYSLSEVTDASLEPLLRDLTGQPAASPVPLGPLPVFPDGASVGLTAASVLGRSTPAATHEDVARLEATLAALPAPHPNDRLDDPWFTERARVLEALRTLKPAPSAAAAAPSGAAPDWQSVAPGTVQAPWMRDWGRQPHIRDPSIAVHLMTLDAAPPSARRRAALIDALPTLAREAGLVTVTDALDVSTKPDLLQTAPARTSWGEATPTRFAGVRINDDGAVSAWFTLARDTMGAVFEPDDVSGALERALQLAAQAFAQLGAPEARVAVAAEVHPTSTLTTGRLADLGHRTRTSMRGALGQRPLLVEPEESLPLSTLVHVPADAAQTLMDLLLRSWNR